MGMITPHLEANKSDIAQKVIMPGDPLRAKFIAENFLTDVNCYNKVRNMYGFTGLYKGEKVSIQGSGMGAPSIGIYSYELYNFFDVEEIIRVGTAGGLAECVKPRDIVFAQGACYDINFARQYNLPGTYAPISDFSLLRRAVEAAEKLDINYHVGNVLTCEVYYDASQSLADWLKMGVLAVEMEAAALFMNAAFAKKKAMCICTISNCPLSGTEDTTPEEREKTFTDMMKISLDL